VKYLALPIGLVAALVCVLPIAILFVFGGICNWCLNLWNEEASR